MSAWAGWAMGERIAARWMNKPLVLEVNGDHLAEMELQGNAPKGAQRWLSSRVTRFAAHEAMHSVATGEGWRRRFIERWAVTPDRVSVVENGSELIDILTRDDLKAFCNGEEPERPVKIVYVGGFDPWHGLPILVRAAAQLAIAGIEFQLLLIGTGSGEDDIKELVRSCGLAQRVIFTGQVSPPEMAGYLSQADIACFTLLWPRGIFRPQATRLQSGRPGDRCFRKSGSAGDHRTRPQWSDRAALR
jgi:glycosyltransferase involved in cell wall biosynthesis